jgi:hypothetical protein
MSSDDARVQQGQIPEKSSLDLIAQNKFLEAKWADKTCEVCLHSSWALGRTNHSPASTLGLVDVHGNPTNTYWPVMPFVCTNCGNTKLIFIMVITDWLRSEEGIAAMQDQGQAT